VREQTTIGGYRLIKRIGSGGMSTVFEAEDGAGDRVALKLFHPGLLAEESGRSRLRREVAMLQKVRGPFVAEVVDAETDEAEAFIVTELVDGPTLEQDVADSGVYDGGDLADLARRLGEAVESIHRVGVLHRDLKPSNVMIGPKGPVLIDFGIAQLGEDARLTMPGSLTHTPGYCDPVVLNGGDPNPQADWWSLAAVVAFAATGRPPSGTGSPPEARRAGQCLLRTGLVRAEGEVGHDQGTLGRSGHRAGGHHHLIELHRQRGVVPQHDIADGVAHQQQVGSRRIQDLGGHGVVGGEHDQLGAVLLGGRQVMNAHGLAACDDGGGRTVRGLGCSHGMRLPEVLERASASDGPPTSFAEGVLRNLSDAPAH